MQATHRQIQQAQPMLQYGSGSFKKESSSVFFRNEVLCRGVDGWSPFKTGGVEGESALLEMIWIGLGDQGPLLGRY